MTRFREQIRRASNTRLAGSGVARAGQELRAGADPEPFLYSLHQPPPPTSRPRYLLPSDLAQLLSECLTTLQHHGSLWQKQTLKLRSIKRLESFVTNEIRDRGKAKFVTVASGSFNMVFHFKFSGDTSQQVTLRLPKPGHSAAGLVAEKLENEVHWMQYMEEHNLIRVPHVYSWSTCGPDDIGPYILMDFAPGSSLAASLVAWTKSDSPDDKKKLISVYEQAANMYLQLYRPRFDRIGSITKTPEGQWVVTKRPLTLDMHQQVTGVPGFHTGRWPTRPLLRSRDYIDFVIGLHKQQLNHLRNLNIPIEVEKESRLAPQEADGIDRVRARDIARGRYIARNGFAMPAVTAFLDDGDNGPFAIFNPDLCARNILVDPETAESTAVIDHEYTNPMPAAFAQDPPLWQLPWQLEKTLERDLFPWWMQTYELVLKEFLVAMERVEARQQGQGQGRPLSALMRASWESRQCLVNFAAHNSDCVDAIYWALPEIFPRPDGDLLEEKVGVYQTFTMGQIDAYEEERAAKPGKE
ncbi:hypothetical protein B7494_g2811 [Chlorociboria aeruginascens]|nr:hypothetical protein B7494_g2811 [Chlorociboria aeruginascens]